MGKRCNSTRLAILAGKMWMRKKYALCTAKKSPGDSVFHCFLPASFPPVFCTSLIPPKLHFSPQLSPSPLRKIHPPQMPNAFSCLSSFHCNCSESVLLLEAFSFYHIIMGNSLMWQERSWYNYPAFWPSRNKTGYTPRCSSCFFNISVIYWEEGVAGG